jgi:rhodanese-related sulfurtransferase
MRRDMPFNPFYTGAATATVLLILTLLIYYRIRHLIRTGRELSYLIGQDQFEYTLIDVGSPEDFARGHIPSARNVPYQECTGFFPTENMFEKIYVYGRNRRKARIVAKMLDTTGYFSVTLYGTFRSWRGPVEKNETEKENL